MGDNITASAEVSEASVSEIKDFEGVIAKLEKASPETSSDKKPVSKPNTKPLFFDHDVISDTGNVVGEYIPKTEAEYNRLKPFAVEEK